MGQKFINSSIHIKSSSRLSAAVAVANYELLTRIPSLVLLFWDLMDILSFQGSEKGDEKFVKDKSYS